jgi:hypothetical protein
MAKTSLASLLKDVLSEAESRLVDLGRLPDAWRQLKPYVTVEFGYDPNKTLRVLGPPAEPNRDYLPTREIPVMAEVRRHWKRCQRCQHAARDPVGPFADHARLGELRKCKPKLFERYFAQAFSDPPEILAEPADWSAAFLAALANEGLATDDPGQVFAIGAAIERQRILDLLSGRLGRRMRRDVRQNLVAEIKGGRRRDIEELAVRKARSRVSSQQQKERREWIRPIHDAIRRTYGRHHTEGITELAAAKATWADPKLRGECSALAAGERPWRGSEFYSLAAVRRIVRQG